MVGHFGGELHVQSGFLKMSCFWGETRSLEGIFGQNLDFEDVFGSTNLISGQGPILIPFNLFSAVFGYFREIFAKPPCI